MVRRGRAVTKVVNRGHRLSYTPFDFRLRKKQTLRSGDQGNQDSFGGSRWNDASRLVNGHPGSHWVPRLIFSASLHHKRAALRSTFPDFPDQPRMIAP